MVNMCLVWTSIYLNNFCLLYILSYYRVSCAFKTYSNLLEKRDLFTFISIGEICLNCISICILGAQPTLIDFNPIQGGSEHILFRDVCNFTPPSNFWTTDDRELKFYMVDIHKLFWKIMKTFWLKALIIHLWRHNYAIIIRF